MEKKHTVLTALAGGPAVAGIEIDLLLGTGAIVTAARSRESAPSVDAPPLNETPSAVSRVPAAITRAKAEL